MSNKCSNDRFVCRVLCLVNRQCMVFIPGVLSGLHKKASKLVVFYFKEFLFAFNRSYFKIIYF